MTLTPHAERLLDVYSIGGGTSTHPKPARKARELRDLCLEHGLPEYAKSIEQFVTRGCTHAYEDFDVLNAACCALYRTGFRFPEEG